MADYNVTFPDGTPLVIQTGTINNTYDIPLTGQDAISYGDDFATAYIRLLSSFANTSAPSFGTTRTSGQLWFDTTPSTGGLNVFDGISWDSIALDAGVVHTTGAESIDGVKTFTDASAFTAAGSPFTVNSTTTVSNLSVEFLDNKAFTFFATAPQGVLADNAEPDLLNPGVNGYVLSSTTGGTRSWISPAVGTGNVDPEDTSNFSSPGSTSVLLSDDPTGDQQPGTHSGLTYDATSSELSATLFIGNLQGNATTATNATDAATAATTTAVTVADESSDTTCFPLFVTGATGDLPAKSGTNLTFNSSSGLLTATIFSGSGASLTNLNMQAAGNSGTLQKALGGTSVTTSTGNQGAFVYQDEPTFTSFIIVPEINFSTGVDIQFNATTSLGTQDNTISDNTAGAFVIDGNSATRNVGFNEMLTTSVAASGTQEFDRANVGHSWRATHSSGILAFNTEAADTDIPIGAMWVVRNFSSSTGTVTVEGGVGSTVRHYDGSGGIPPESVNESDEFLLSRGGIATIVKVADDEYEMWGIGITGGA